MIWIDWLIGSIRSWEVGSRLGVVWAGELGPWLGLVGDHILSQIVSWA